MLNVSKIVKGVKNTIKAKKQPIVRPHNITEGSDYIVEVNNKWGDSHHSMIFGRLQHARDYRKAVLNCVTNEFEARIVKREYHGGFILETKEVN